MELNADFARRAAVHAQRLDWVPSPAAGVERRMLDRIGDEVARATSIVRYAAHSAFPEHVHGGGEEFLVLDGVFEDEHGAFPAGSYVRNPPTSKHTPRSGPGCTLFVKLWQFDPADRTTVRLDARARRPVPVPGEPGVAAVLLHRDDRETVRLEQWAPGAAIAREPVGGLELLVVSGSFTESGEAFVEQSWLRLPPGAALDAVAGDDGARVWSKEGHLAHVRGAPPAR